MRDLFFRGQSREIDPPLRGWVCLGIGTDSAGLPNRSLWLPPPFELDQTATVGCAFFCEIDRDDERWTWKPVGRDLGYHVFDDELPHVWIGTPFFDGRERSCVFTVQSEDEDNPFSTLVALPIDGDRLSSLYPEQRWVLPNDFDGARCLHNSKSIAWPVGISYSKNSEPKCLIVFWRRILFESERGFESGRFQFELSSAPSAFYLLRDGTIAALANDQILEWKPDASQTNLGVKNWISTFSEAVFPDNVENSFHGPPVWNCVVAIEGKVIDVEPAKTFEAIHPTFCRGLLSPTRALALPNRWFGFDREIWSAEFCLKPCGNQKTVVVPLLHRNGSLTTRCAWLVARDFQQRGIRPDGIERLLPVGFDFPDTF